MTLDTSENVNEEPEISRPLHLHTLESLCADLISGRPVNTESGDFRLTSSDARAILNWYRQRKDKWGARMSEADADAIADCVGVLPPKLAATGKTESAKNRLRLRRIQAHRFGGIHSYGTSATPPDDFIFEPESSVTLFEGWNGTGKTSLLNAIVWCLTGELLRPQRPPSSGSDEFDCVIDRGETDDGPNLTNHGLTPVTPLPNTATFMPLPSQKIPVDTWVELTFVNDSGVVLPPIRRTQNRTASGKINETPPNLAALGCDPIAFKLSTTMPALLQHIQIGAASDLGRAVSELTGLGDLVTLQGHAARSRGYFTKTSIKKCEGAIEQADTRFREATSDLERRFTEFPNMRPVSALPIASSNKGLEGQIATLEAHFQTQKSTALKEAQTILGEGFNPDDESSRNDLVENAAPAQATLLHISQLKSASRLGALMKLSETEKQQARELIANIEIEGQIIADLLSEPAIARRKQLYAQVASWMNAHSTTETSHCHLCSRPLLDQIDPVTGKLVSVHLADAQLDNPELLSQTVQSWAMHTLSTLAEKLPTALRDERDEDLPNSPSELIRQAVCHELFDDPSFRGALSALKGETASVFNSSSAVLPEFEEPNLIKFPVALEGQTDKLKLAIGRVQRALAFADWRASAKEAVSELFLQVVGKTIQNEGQKALSETITKNSPLVIKLRALQYIVDGASPISNALILCKRLSDALLARRRNEKRIDTIGKASQALTELETLGQLAGLQVTALQKTLDKSARAWRDKVYHDPNSAGHKLKRTGMSSAGILDFHVGSETITAPAQHVSNASALRSSLIGFFLAFREHVLKARGGLDLLLLDDPQELLDQHNRAKMGATLIELGATKSQLLVTTYDRQFAQLLVEEGGAGSKVAHFSVHAVNAQRDRIEIAPSRRHVDEKRTVFEAKLDDHQAAADYANATRIYLETRLRDLFDDPVYPAYATHVSKPGFGDHLDQLRSLVSNPPNDLFRHQLVQGFARSPALVSSHDCYRVLNDSHHSPANVSYQRVKTVANWLKDLSKTVELMHQAFRDWRWQNKLPETYANDNLPALSTITPTLFTLPICPDLAAFTGGVIGSSSQEEISESLDSSWFADKSLFYIRSANLGFAIPAGSIAIVESQPSEGRDRNLVIARKKGETLARRLFRQKEISGYALAAETPDPRESPPTKLSNSDEYAIHRIVGCLFLDVVPPQSSREAVELNSDDILTKIEVVFRLNKESAVPLALPRQLLLGGKLILGSDFSQHEGSIAAITLKDGNHVLKRIGGALSSKFPYARHFETIGGLGQSIVLQTEEIEGSPIEAPVIEQARLAIGVLYET